MPKIHPSIDKATLGLIDKLASMPITADPKADILKAFAMIDQFYMAKALARSGQS